MRVSPRSRLPHHSPGSKLEARPQGGQCVLLSLGTRTRLALRNAADSRSPRVERPLGVFGSSRPLFATPLSCVAVGDFKVLHVRANAPLPGSTITTSVEFRKGRRPFSGLQTKSFFVYWDNHTCVSEEGHIEDSRPLYPPVAVLLDISNSMYGKGQTPDFASRENAIPDLKKSAITFIKQLRASGYTNVKIFAFANDASEISEDLFEISYAKPVVGKQEHTAIYWPPDKLNQMSAPGAVMILFSDGADTYTDH